jgi:proteasome accessory factor B
VASTAKLERQLNLLATLLETRRPLTRAEIRERVEGYPEDDVAYRRAFERDKDELRAMGVAIDLAPIPGRVPADEGYRIPADKHYLRDPGLTADELAALHFAASAVRTEGIEGIEGLRKLGGRPSDAPAGGAPAPTEGVDVAALPVEANLVPLFQGVAEHRAARFSYNETPREVDPYRLDFQRGHWYLSAFDHVRGEERNFRVDRIEGGIELGPQETFTPPATTAPGERLQPWRLGDGPEVVARIAVDADQAAVAVAEAGEDAVAERRDDGSLVLRLDVTNPAGLRTFVVGFLEHAEILEPADLRDSMVEWLEAIETHGRDAG